MVFPQEGEAESWVEMDEGEECYYEEENPDANELEETIEEPSQNPMEEETAINYYETCKTVQVNNYGDTENEDYEDWDYFNQSGRDLDINFISVYSQDQVDDNLSELKSELLKECKSAVHVAKIDINMRLKTMEL